MQNPATHTDLTKLGYASTNPSVEQARLDQAWRALVAEVPSLPGRLAADLVDSDMVVDVVCAAALRVLNNPEGAERVSGSIDDYREDVTLRNTTDDLYFTRAELRRLQPADYTGGAGSMSYA